MTNPNGLPGPGNETVSAFRNFLTTADNLVLKPGGVVIDASESRDPGNTGYVDVLRGGLLLGKITTGGRYAPSVIGTLGDDYDGAATQMNVLLTPEATEIARRLGSSGTFKLTGPPAANGIVRTETITYSAVGSGTGGDEVQTFVADAASSAGSYTILLQKPDGTTVRTASIAYDDTLAECQTAITLALGAVAGWVASSAGSAVPFSSGPIDLVLTASGTGYLKTDFPMCSVDPDSLTGVTTITGTETTRGIPVAGTITVTAVGAAADTVQTITVGGTSSGGTLKLGFRDVADPAGEIKWTDTIAWSATEATMDTSLQAALDDLLGANVVVASNIADTASLVMVLTWSGTGSTELAQEEVHVDTAALTGASTVGVVMTTAGVTASENDFAAGSFIQPVDGSETIIGIQGIEDGIKVTNDAGSEIDVQDARLVIGAEVATAGIVLYPTDTSLIAWVKSALRATGIGYTFDDDF
jgi:hypothetical protein